MPIFNKPFGLCGQLTPYFSIINNIYTHTHTCTHTHTHVYIQHVFLDRLSTSLQSVGAIGIEAIFAQTMDMFNLVSCPVHNAKNL
jgi:hypothetical protein